MSSGENSSRPAGTPSVRPGTASTRTSHARRSPDRQHPRRKCLPGLPLLTACRFSWEGMGLRAAALPRSVLLPRRLDQRLADRQERPEGQRRVGQALKPGQALGQAVVVRRRALGVHLDQPAQELKQPLGRGGRVPVFAGVSIAAPSTAPASAAPWSAAPVAMAPATPAYPGTRGNPMPGIGRDGLGVFVPGDADDGGCWPGTVGGCPCQPPWGVRPMVTHHGGFKEAQRGHCGSLIGISLIGTYPSSARTKTIAAIHRSGPRMHICMSLSATSWRPSGLQLFLMRN